MNLPFTFARRYLFSRKSSNAINIISWVSVLGMFVGSFGLVLVLSVFNGFEGLVISLYNAFNPDFTITAVKGKSFVPDSGRLAQLQGLEGIQAVSSVIEENVLLTYGEQQYIATIKGVEDHYGAISGIDSALFDGVFLLRKDDSEYAVLGAGIEQSLGINYEDPFGNISVYLPRKDHVTVLQPQDAFRRELIKPAGSFAIQAEFDSKYLFVPISFARRLTGYRDEITSLEVSAHPGTSLVPLQQAIASIFGNDFIIRNRLQQNETLYKVMRTEKWAVYAVLTLILVVAAFNIIGSLSMLVIEKRKDISILKAMGAGPALIQQIFLAEGLLLSLIGCAGGFMVSITIILLQYYYEIIKIGGQSFVIDAYPVAMKGSDLILVFVTVMVIGLLAAWFPARRAARTELDVTLMAAH